MLKHYIKSGLLSARGAYGYFFLKHVDFAELVEKRSRAKYISNVFEICDGDIIAMPKQEHTDKVLVLSRKDAAMFSSDMPADSIVTDIPGAVIGVKTADCVPILLYDEKNKISGAAHAGWRGAFSGILQNTVLAMESLGANVSGIAACLGPSIRQYSYEVSYDLHDRFIKQSKSNSIFFKNNGEKYLFDLPGYCRSVLSEMGVEIEDLCIDTYTNSDILYSYRKINRSNTQARSGFGQLSLIRFA